MFCNQCGRQNPDDSRFCSSCGYRFPEPLAVQSENPSAVAPQTTATPTAQVLSASSERLTKCPDCGRAISSSSTTCPHCGKANAVRLPLGKSAFGLMLIVLSIFPIIGFVNNSSPSSAERGYRSYVANTPHGFRSEAMIRNNRHAMAEHDRAERLRSLGTYLLLTAALVVGGAISLKGAKARYVRELRENGRPEAVSEVSGDMTLGNSTDRCPICGGCLFPDEETGKVVCPVCGVIGNSFETDP
jgi:hypothetical protein